MHNISNRSIRERCGNKDSLLQRVGQITYRWFGYMERMDEGRLTKRIYRADMDGVKRRRWRGRVEDLVERVGFRLEECDMLARDRGDWKIIVYGSEMRKRCPEIDALE